MKNNQTISPSLRFLHIVRFTEFGGVERILLDFIKHTQQQGHIHVISATTETIPEFAELFFQKGVKRLSYYKNWGNFRLPNFPRILRRYNRNRIFKAAKPDVIVVWNYISILADWAPPKGIPVIYYDHGVAKSYSNLTHPYAQDLLNRLHHIITVSHSIKRTLQLKLPELKTPITVLPNQLSPAFTLPPTSNKTLSKDKPIYLGYAGRLSEEKCVSLIILATAILKQRGISVKTFIAGKGIEREHLENMVKQQKLENEISFLGFVQDIGQFFQSIDIMLLPSAHDSASLAAIEALSYSLPVIVSAIDGQPEVVDDHICGICVQPKLPLEEYIKLIYSGSPMSTENFYDPIYYPKEDKLVSPLFVTPEDLADAVLEITTNKSCYLQYSKHAKQKAEQLNHFDLLCNKIIELVYFLQKNTKHD